MPRLQGDDLSGMEFGYWTVLGMCEHVPGRDRHCICRCKCGKTLAMPTYYLRKRKGPCASCSKTKHALSRTRVYMAWYNMIDRCEYQGNASYPAYGGRGISVCEEWHDFETFFRDMGHPQKGLSLDRIGVNGNYEKGNVRWASSIEQNQNQRRNVNLTVNGETKCIAEWARVSGIDERTLRGRIGRGWSHNDAVTKIPGPQGKNKPEVILVNRRLSNFH